MDWPLGPDADCKVRAIVKDWMTLKTMVRYRVYCVILRRPSSPSFCRRSRYGKTTVINCKMIDEVMYGMMPSAKIVKRRKLPPLKRSKMPSTDPADWLNICSSTAVLIPGVGMCAPMRYTASSASVNSTRFRKSSMRNMFFTASTNRFMPVSCGSSLSYNLERTTRLGNLFFCRRTERLRVNRQLGRQLAIAENLDGVRGAAHKTVRAEQLGSHRLAGRKNVQFRQVHDRVRHAEWVVKTALRHAPVQRHLSAFKAAAARIAAARLLSLVAGARGLTELRSHAAANANFLLARARGRLQIREREGTAPFRRRRRRLVLTTLAGPSRAARTLSRHRSTPPLPRGAAPCESCRAFPACPGARPPDAFSASRGRGWFDAYHRCS